MPDFIPGLKLGELFYQEAVRPALERRFPGLCHSAGIIGSGSEVLGFDTPMSADHHWGPRVMLFLNAEDHDAHAAAIQEALRHELPYEFYGWPTNFADPDPNDNGVQLLQSIQEGPVNHRVEVLTIFQFFADYLDCDPYAELDAPDWLTIPSQKLRTIVGGAVYHDAVGLNDIRQKFAWYPHDVWLYLLAAGWTRIGQEEPFVGRTGYVGDDLGSQVIAARLVRDLMRLCFLMERQYAPYSKWYGTAFEKLACAQQLTPIFRWAMLAQSWREREKMLAQAYEIVAGMHNALGITEPMQTKVSNFFGRPFKVIHGGDFSAAIKAQIIDESVRRIPVDIGSIDQFSDSTDLTEATHLRQRLKLLYS